MGAALSISSEWGRARDIATLSTPSNNDSSRLRTPPEATQVLNPDILQSNVGLPVRQVRIFAAGTACLRAQLTSWHPWPHQGAMVFGMRRWHRANRIVTRTTGSLPSDMVHADVSGACGVRRASRGSARTM